MNVERLRKIAAALPHTRETLQWGDNLVLWVGDKADGGKMFALVELGQGKHVASLAAGVEGAAELLERDGIVPAPYLARAHWVAMERWDALTDAEWRERLTAAHALVWAKLPRKAKALMEAAAGKRSSK